MVVCPVCEHAQDGGTECEVCGRRLQVAAEAAAPIPPLEGLESTLRPGVLADGAGPMPELEQTCAAPVPAPPGPGLPDLERSGAAPVDPPIAPIPDVERTGDGAPADERTPYPVLVVCRYCRTPASVGEKLCSRCGMRLPLAAPAVHVPGPEEGVRMCTCGLPVQGPRCPSCGARTG